MFATETGELVRYSSAVRRGTVVNTILILMTMPHLISVFFAEKLQAWVLNVTGVTCAVTISMYFFLQFVLIGYAYLQYVPGLVCTMTLAMAVITRYFRSLSTLTLLAVLTMTTLIAFAVITGLSWSRKLLKPELQSKMMPVIYFPK